MPHCRPMMNTSPATTIVDERIRMPDWRRASPKKRSTRPPRMSRTTRAQNRAISPKLAIHSRGTVSQPTTSVLLGDHEADPRVVLRLVHPLPDRLQQGEQAQPAREPVLVTALVAQAPGDPVIVDGEGQGELERMAFDHAAILRPSLPPRDGGPPLTRP